jgi:polyisoprenoid-binding protein YceI
VTSRRRSPLVIGLVAVTVLGGIAAAGGLAYLFLRPAAPAAVSQASATPLTSAPASTLGAGASNAGGTIGPEGLDGTWTVDTSIGSFSDFSSSFVGYRVNETLAQNRANVAVGRTPVVSGSLVLQGSTIPSVEITANLSRLTSDDDRRDGRLHEQAIETDRFPTATFKLTTPIELGAVPVDGQAITATAVGELTLHGVTKTVSIPIQATLSGDVVTVTGTLDIVFADYSIERPTSFFVLSIEDHGVMELQLHFRHG